MTDIRQETVLTEDGPVSEMFNRDCYSKDMTWDEYDKYSKLSLAAIGVLRDAGILV